MNKKEKLTMITTFSGIGCQERGFIDSNLFDLDIIATSDIDKEAILSYAAIHCGLTDELVERYQEYPSKDEMVNELKTKNIGYDFVKNKAYDWDKLAKQKGRKIERYWLAMKLANNVGDICKVEALPYCDILTFSFPCQSISVAGRQEGMVKGKTRSGLVYEIVRLIEKSKENNTLPKYLMLENVSALVSKKFIGDFNNLNSFFDEIGYNIYWSLINGKDCGVPQNRNRCFAIYIRKDIDTKKYTFPQPFDNGMRLKDILEDKVDEKYYISDEKVQNFLKNLLDNKSLDDSTELRQLGYINDYNGDANRVYSDDCARTLKAEAGGGGAKTGLYVVNQIGIDKSLNDTKVIDNANCITARENRGISNRRAEGTAVLETPDTSYCLDANYYKGTTPEQYVEKKRRQLVFENDVKKVGKTTTKSGRSHQKDDVINPNGISTTLLSTDYKQPKQICIEDTNIRIRKLTSKECFRLMGFDDSAYEIASKVVSESQLYKQAGNGIITNCCELLAEHLYKAQYDDTYICTDEKYAENFTNPQAE